MKRLILGVLEVKMDYRSDDFESVKKDLENNYDVLAHYREKIEDLKEAIKEKAGKT